MSNLRTSRITLETAAVVLLILAFLAALFLGSFITYVGAGEVVLKDCGDTQTVWRAPEDIGFHWVGLCDSRTFHAVMHRSFRVRAKRESVNYTIHGTATVLAPEGDAEMRAFYGRHFSEEKFFDRSVLPFVTETTRRLAEDSTWLKGSGGWVQRQFKDGLEYGLKRLSPTGHLWTSPESRHELQTEINDAIQKGTPDPDPPITVELGIIIER